MKSSSFDVVVVNFNTRSHLRACLEDVAAGQPNEIVVVDNASSDGSVEMVRNEFPDVALVENSVNPGYGAGANRGIAACSSEYVLLLNSDTRIRRGELSALASYLDQNPRVAVAGPRLLNADGTLQPSSYPHPTPLFVFMEESTLGRWIRYVPYAKEHYLRTWSHSHSKSVPWVLGAALAIRRSAFETVGGFDESFFLYWEEIDLCQRLRESGWKIHFTPLATLTHIGGASTGPRGGEMTRQLFNSAAHFYRRHYSRWHLVALRIVILLVMAVRMGRELVLFLYDTLSLKSSDVMSPPPHGANLITECRIFGDAFGGWQESS